MSIDIHTAAPAATAYVADLARVWDADHARQILSVAPASPFQRAEWLSAWYRSLGTRANVMPLIVSVREATSGAPAMLLPLVVHFTGMSRVVEFADLGITDYNAPIMLDRAPATEADARSMLAAVLRTLDAEGDTLRLSKMPATIAGRPNPLAATGLSRPSHLAGNIVRIDGSWSAYRASLDGKVRRELDRSWRVFLRDGDDARFVRATTREHAHRLMARLATMQRARIESLGLPYLLDGEGCRRFYYDLIEDGLDSGYTVVTALENASGDEVVAALLGVADGDWMCMIRLGQAGGRWSGCSPGRLLFERTMHAMHEAGLTGFDFTIGDYAYKETFRVARTPLVDLVLPLSWRGHASRRIAHAGDSTRRHLRSVPLIYSPLKRAAGLFRTKLRARATTSVEAPPSATT